MFIRLQTSRETYRTLLLFSVKDEKVAFMETMRSKHRNLSKKVFHILGPNRPQNRLRAKPRTSRRSAGDAPPAWCSACCNRQSAGCSPLPWRGRCAARDPTPSSDACSGTPAEKTTQQGAAVTTRSEGHAPEHQRSGATRRHAATWRWDLVTDGAHFMASLRISPQRAAKSFTML